MEQHGDFMMCDNGSRSLVGLILICCPCMGYFQQLIELFLGVLRNYLRLQIRKTLYVVVVWSV